MSAYTTHHRPARTVITANIPVAKKEPPKQTWAEMAKSEGKRQGVPRIAPSNAARALGPGLAHAITDLLQSGPKSLTKINRSLGANDGRTKIQLAEMVSNGTVKETEFQQKGQRVVRGYTL